MKKAAIGFVLVVLLIGAGLYWLAPKQEGAATGKHSIFGFGNGADGMAGARVDTSHFESGLEGLPVSLRDTEVDGELEVDANGRLKITNGVRRVFDYFLAATGEESLDTLLARIRAYIRHKLPAGAAAEAEKLLDAYIAYKRGLSDIQQAVAPGSQQIDINAVRKQMQEVQALRTRYFSQEVIAAFFGDDDAFDQYSLSRVDIMQNTQLSATERARQLAALEEQLPPSLQESMKAINQYQNLQSLTDDWKKRNGSVGELRQIRESLVGPEAADRLETLDQDVAQWSQRMNAWLAERTSILSNVALSEQDRQAQVDRMRQQRFQSNELVRVESIERMNDRGEKIP
jgi:lipase chaperone LimK